MSRLLPFQSETEVPQDRAPRVVDLEGEDAEKVFGALSSETARSIFTALHEEPMTASDVADAVDSSIQNVRYHLENLSEAGLIEVVDTWYSSRGNEMKVYAPKDGPLIVSSDESRASRIRTALSRLVGGVGVLLASSLLVQYGWQELFGGLATTGASSDGSAPGPETELSGTAASDDQAAGDAASTTASTTSEGDGGDGADVGINDVDSTTTASGGGEETSAMTGEPTTVEAATQTEAARTEPATTADAATTAEPATEMAAGNESFNVAAESTRTAADAATTAASGGAGGGDLLAGGLPPGAMFFLGGFVVLVALIAYQYSASPYR
ncbi:helix-turn-helix transcriptional regulator [Halorubellus sp. JP-L1]|uniref:ArsR/SmtB family transcription factor n=1 Tax=Halorubellus sp. JP-L1 TaxID=2715753 RepID=UPI00140BEA51|nr:helix-turn-helix domain-containing protein [Halorubellus sp. JP-L1]NHN41113.1 helix-turn-helix transcriptional regulator [Halorubellus sp. JP-L1]